MVDLNHKSAIDINRTYKDHANYKSYTCNTPELDNLIRVTTGN